MYMVEIDDLINSRIMWPPLFKGDKTKHISPKFFYTHELQKNGEIDVQQIRSSDNLADLFTKALPTSTFRKLIYKIGMDQPKDVDMRGSPL